MTKLLVNFDANGQNHLAAIGCDIIGFDYRPDETIGLQSFSVPQKGDYAFLLSLSIDDYLQDFSNSSEKMGENLVAFDFIKLEIDIGIWSGEFSDIENLARQKATIAQVNGCEKLPDLLALLPRMASIGIYGVMLAPKQRNGKLNGQFSIVEMGVFIEQSHKNGLAACLIGGIEAPDIPRLLPFAPDILCFDITQFLTDGDFNKQQAHLIRSLIPREREDVDYTNSIALGTDRILVNNFVLPMAIGAYNHERNRLQKVRFSVAADVLRLSVNPEDMRHIFSYDLIIDGIKRLALLGHVELVETLAERIAAFILSHPRVQKVIVRVEKLELEPESVGIEIERIKRSH